MLVVENVFWGARECGVLFLLGEFFVESVVWLRGGG